MPFVNIHSAFEIKCMNHINMILQEFKLYDMHPSLSSRSKYYSKFNYYISDINKNIHRKLMKVTSSAPSAPSLQMRVGKKKKKKYAIPSGN